MIVRASNVWKPRDLCLEFPDSLPIWQSPGQQGRSNFEVIQQSNILAQDLKKRRYWNMPLVVTMPEDVRCLNSSRLSKLYTRQSTRGSDIDWLFVWCQVTFWTSVGLLSIETLGTIISEILIKIAALLLQKIRFNMPSLILWAFCLGLNVLMPRVINRY